MLTFVDIVFSVYMFLSLYMLVLFLVLYISNKDKIYDYPKGKLEPISIVMPCYNDGEHIGEAIESLLNIDYPKEMIEIIIVDDKSTDNSIEIIKRYAKRYKNIKLIQHEKNSGGAAAPTNTGIRQAKYNYVAFVDSDSTPERDSLKKMIGFLQEDKRVAGVTCAILVKNPKNIMHKVQAYEYYAIAFTRKLLDMVDSVYVAPGPLALYKKKALIEVGLLDTKNLTQDIELSWNLMSHGYKVRMCLATKVHAASPPDFKGWWKQRIRWNIGGTQTLLKYKGFMLKAGMLGGFVIPFFAVSLFLGVFGLGLFTYLFLRQFLVGYLSTKYSLYASTALVSLQDFSFAPSVLNFFGAALFFLGLWFTLFGLKVSNARELRGKRNIFNLLMYMIVYLTIAPINLIVALYKMAIGKYSW